jgi:hypothetical protein
MDQARWLVVFSVVVVMITVLSLLHRYSRPTNDIVDNVDVRVDQSRTALSQQNTEPSTQVGKQGRFKYSTPPKHVFSMEKSSTFVEENKEFKDKGQILP